MRFGKGRNQTGAARVPRQRDGTVCFEQKYNLNRRSKPRHRTGATRGRSLAPETGPEVAVFGILFCSRRFGKVHRWAMLCRRLIRNRGLMRILLSKPSVL